jgi:hypothetical protein
MDDSPVAVEDGVTSDPEGRFEAVVEELRAWEPGGSGNLAESGRARAFLDARLNEGTGSPWERDVVERRRGSTAADLSVNGEIGVVLVDDAGPATAADLRVALALLGERYNFVVVYWLDASPAGADYRRSVERGASAEQLHLAGLRFVTAPVPTRPGDGSHGALAALGELRGVALGLLLAALGVGAVWWALAATAGLGRSFLVGVAGLFVGTLALATYLTR